MNPLKSICPLYIRDKRGWALPIGSSLLLAIGSERFVVTCAHVADHAAGTEDFQIHTFVDGCLQQLRGEGCITNLPPSRNRNDDQADVSFFKLEPEIASAMEAQSRFWPIARVALGVEAVRDTHYTFVGFPARDSKPRGRGIIRAELLKITAGAYSDDDYARVGANPLTHIGIRLEGGPLVGYDGIERHNPRFPSMLNGMSGGAVLKGFHRQQKGEIIEPVLVGMCMELPLKYPDSFLGVRITAVLEGIRMRFPELSIHIPHDPDLKVVARRNRSGGEQ